MLIGEVAKRARLKTSAIRYYESEALLPKPPRRSGRRVYDGSVLDRLALIELAKTAGFSVAELKHLIYGFSRRTSPAARGRVLAARKSQELDEAIARTQPMKQVLGMVASCECPTFDDCVAAMRNYPWRKPIAALRTAYVQIEVSAWILVLGKKAEGWAGR